MQFGPDDADPVDSILEDYIDRVGSGEEPDISEYCNRYPEHADELRQLIRTMDLANMSVSAGSVTIPIRSYSDPLPEAIGEYRILSEIGRGGMGIVYEAEHESLGRLAAVKVLFQSLSKNAVAVERFHREARAIAKLHHTSIVPLYEVGEDNGQFFLAMQLISGSSLDRVISSLKESTSLSEEKGFAGRKPANALSSSSSNRSSGALSSGGLSDADSTGSADRSRFYRRVATIGADAADALYYAHERGIIHRDVKPSNLILDDEGCIWLTDFGLAKTGEDGVTETGDIVGTIRYMAPERFRGQCDELSDVYALGLSLYELLTLRPAFATSDRFQMIDMVANQQPTRPRAIRSHIPKDLETIVLKAVDKVANRRYATARDMADDLRRFVSGEPIRARRTSLLEQFTLWARRNKSLAASLAGIAALLIVLGVGSALTALHQQQLRREADEARDETEQNLYYAEMSLAGQAIGRSGGIRQIELLTDRWRPQPGDPERRGWEWYFLRSNCDVEDLTIKPESPGLYRLRWSPDNQKVAVAAHGRRVSVWDAITGKRLQTFDEHTDAVTSLAWSPDGKWIASGSYDNTVQIWDAESAEIIRKIDGSEGPVLSIAWSPDGQRLARGDRVDVQVASPFDDSAPTTLELGPKSITSIQWNPDGTQVFGACDWSNQGSLWDIASGKSVRSMKGWRVRWSPDGQEIKFMIRTIPNGDIELWDAENGTRIAALVGHTSYVRSVTWSKDGSKLLSCSQDSTSCIWDIEREDLDRSFQGHTDEVYDVRWSPDETKIASASIDGSLKIWSVQDPVRATLRGPDARVRGLRWNAEGTTLAAAYNDKVVRVWDASSREMIAELEGHGQDTHSVSWSPDGTLLASTAGDQMIRIWDVSSWQCRDVYEHNTHAFRRVHEVDWHPDGVRLASIGQDNTVRIWNTQTDEQVGNLKSEPTGGHCVRWNPDGSLFAAGDSSGMVNIGDAETYVSIRKIKAHDEDVISVAWNSDGSVLASASRDATVRIWNATTGELLQTLVGHHGPVWSVHWSPDDQRLATTSRDGSVKVWNATSGSEAISLRFTNGEVWCCEWNPDGKRLAAGDERGRVVIWDASRGYEFDKK